MRDISSTSLMATTWLFMHRKLPIPAIREETLLPLDRRSFAKTRHSSKAEPHQKKTTFKHLSLRDKWPFSSYMET